MGPTAEETAAAFAALTAAGIDAPDTWLAVRGASIEACTNDDGDKGYKPKNGDTCHTHDGTPAGIAKAKKAALATEMKLAAPDLSDEAVDGLVELAAKEAVLETVDFTGSSAVEIMAEGGPYFGQGSPKEGDYFTGEQLQKLADDTNAAIAAKELRSRVKLGHSKKQKLLAASGLVDAEDGLPSAGVLKNLRVVGEKPKRKLVTDALKVPKKVAQLLKAGSWPGRSVELRNLKSQTKKGTTWRVVDALSLLGEKAPAIRTLDDWLAFFTEGMEPDEAAAVVAAYTDDDDVQILTFAAGDVVWSPADSYEARRAAVHAALNPGPTQMESRYWVRDCSNGRALVCEYGSERKTWVVPYEYDAATGDATLAPNDEWVSAEEAWVEEAAGYAERVGGDRGDTSGVKGKTDKQEPTVKLSDEQIESLAKTFGVDESDAAKRREAVEAKYAEVAQAVPAETEEPPADPPSDPPAEPTEPESSMSATERAEFEVMKAKADRGDRAYEDARLSRRKTAIEGAITAGRLDPEKKELWEGFFDRDEEHTITMLAELPVNEDLLLVYGADDDGISPDSKRSAEQSLSDEVMSMFGLEDDELIQRRQRSAA